MGINQATENYMEALAEIKPCPFCGGTEVVPSFRDFSAGRLVLLVCDGCDAEGPPVVFTDTDEDHRSLAAMEARRRWNIRKPE